MKRIFIAFCLSILVFAQATFADVCDNLKQYTLKNGQVVVIKEVKDNPIVIIDTFVKTGSVNENDKNNGVAHFLEHLFFKGTTNHKRGEFEKAIERRGGVFNAATSRDYTHYYIKINSKYLDEALSLHSDMLLNVAIPQNELDMERKVVMEEITRSIDNPNNKVFDNFMNIIFNGTAYQRKILGTNDVISTISRDEIMTFHDTWYKPANMVTVVVGDVDANKILPKISKAFSFSNATNQNVALKQDPKPLKIKNKTIIEKSNVDTGYMVLGYPSVGNNNLKEAYALAMAASIFASGQNSVLYKTLKENENLILDASAGNYELKDRGVFYVATSFDPQNYAKVLSKIKAELKTFKSTPIEEKRLNLIKNATKRQYQYANESISTVSNMLGYDVAVGNGLCDYCDYISVIDSITPEFVNATMQKYFNDEQLAISVLLPAKSTKISKKDNIINVSNKTNAKLVSQYKGIKKYKLNNGATLLLQKTDANNIIATKIFFKGGSLAEEKTGTASILSDTIMKGTSSKSGKEIEDALDNIGTNISVADAFEYFEISMKTTKDDFESAFPILKDILENPAFSEKDVTIAKTDAINSIKASRDNPQYVAFENFNEELYKNSPFLKTGKVLEKSIPTIEVDDVKSLHKQIFAPKNMLISVVGNFDEKDIINKFSSFNPPTTFNILKESIIKAEFSKLENDVVREENKKAKGSWLVKGWQTKGLSSDDFVALKLISTYLGGGFTSKLFTNLREDKGLAYEVGAISSSNFNSGYFLMYIGTNPENIEVVKNDFDKEIKNLQTKYISQQELCDLKSMLIGRLNLSTETNMSKAYMNGYYEFFDKGYQFGYDYPQLIQRVNVQNILDVANKYFSQPYIMSIVAEDKYTNK